MEGGVYPILDSILVRYFSANDHIPRIPFRTWQLLIHARTPDSTQLSGPSVSQPRHVHCPSPDAGGSTLIISPVFPMTICMQIIVAILPSFRIIDVCLISYTTSPRPISQQLSWIRVVNFINSRISFILRVKRTIPNSRRRFVLRQNKLSRVTLVKRLGENGSGVSKSRKPRTFSSIDDNAATRTKYAPVCSSRLQPLRQLCV